MSSIGPDSRPIATLASQVGLDGLRRIEQPGHVAVADIPDVAHASDALVAQVQVDAGETVLNADAWQSHPAGERVFAGDPALRERLGALDLSQAADGAADAILDALR